MQTTIARRAQGRIFYGWYVIGVAMMGGFIGAGLSQLFMGIMLKPMSEDQGWTRTATSGAITAGTVAAGLLSPVFGKLADRFGPRLLVPIGALVVVGVYLAPWGRSAVSCGKRGIHPARPPFPGVWQWEG